MADKSDLKEIPTELIALADSRGGQRVVLTWNGGSLMRELPARGTVTIGRGAEAVLCVEHASVSRMHARLVIGDAIMVEDLGSSNGTWIDGCKLAPGTPSLLQAGVLVEIGSVLMIIDGGARSAVVPPRVPARDGVVVVDPEMARVHDLVDLVARANLSVILLGETGVGKEVLAQRVHRGSSRATKAFLKVNCAALSESLIESELFGFERGAFTGAVQGREGLLEGAHEGTLFLDEVGELPLSSQAKLLRVLESGEVTRLGSLKPRAINVRFVSATNRDLKELVASGKFRSDLFFRLDGIAIQVPPLRERVAEISALANAFVEGASEAAGKRTLGISEEAIAVLVAHRWPGNVRELKNVIVRSALLCRSAIIQASDLHFDVMGASPRAASVAPPPPAPVSGSERQRIIDALDRSAGNQTQAAKALGMSRRTLLNRLDALDLPRPRKREPGEDA